MLFAAGDHVDLAAAVQGKTGVRTVPRITVPMLSPTTFFLLVINIIYSFFDTFGVIDATSARWVAGCGPSTAPPLNNWRA